LLRTADLGTDTDVERVFPVRLSERTMTAGTSFAALTLTFSVGWWNAVAVLAAAPLISFDTACRT
jgi:hypothetical protein